MSLFHKSVLLEEALDYLRVLPGRKYIDATAGGGGHTQEILKRGGIVLALDRDPEAVSYLHSKDLKNLKIVNENYSHIYKKAIEFGFERVSGILFDLGVSSHQLDSAKRGFSFTKVGPLDMRMDPGLTVSAFDIINNFEKRRINEIFNVFGQERLSQRIATDIVSARQIKQIETTIQLAKIVEEVYRKNRVKTKLHPATKVFQALRIVVNSELLNLEEALAQSVDLLKTNGRLVVISFHSLEDGTVKRFFKGNNNLKTLTKKPIGPTMEEILENPRSRSARLRAAEKL
jgi:16S rRNA (cytosine1402-N4)-methyltransferase